MYRSTVAWFAAAEQKPGPLCVCTSVNAAAQLAGAGIGIGIFPARMVEAYRPAGTIAAIATDPPLTTGRVYVADRVTADQGRTEAVMRILESVTRDLDYFRAPD
jgi:DNA-binding transcriptional LysR family regulator